MNQLMMIKEGDGVEGHLAVWIWINDYHCVRVGGVHQSEEHSLQTQHHLRQAGGQ